MRKFLSLLVVLLTTFTSAWAGGGTHPYLCFTAEEATEVSFNITGTLTTTPSIQYSKDMATWTDYSFTAGDNHTISLTEGDKVYFKATTTNSTFSKNYDKYITFSSTKKVAASGNIMSLLDATCESKTIPCDTAFYQLFSGCTSLTTAPNLPATTLAEKCYKNMFYGCTNLIVNTAGPGTEWKINATSVGTDALKDMFTNTGGTLTGEPTNGTTYYIASLPAVKLNSKGYATYSSDKPFKVNTKKTPTVTVDVKAYKAKVNGEQIVLTEIPSGTSIPAGEGILLYINDANSIGFAHFQQVSEGTAITGNDLKPTTTATTPVVDKSTVSGTIWALDNESSFQKYTGSAFIANRAYLIHEQGIGAKMSLVFGDETTGISQIENGEFCRL